MPPITTVHDEFQESSILMGIETWVIAVSAVVARSIVASGMPASRVRVVLNEAIGSARFDDVESLPVEFALPSVLFVGGLHPRKGVSDLISAFAIVHRATPAAHLTVGDGPHRAQYEAEAFASGPASAITVAGAQPDPRRYLRGADRKSQIDVEHLSIARVARETLSIYGEGTGAP